MDWRRFGFIFIIIVVLFGIVVWLIKNHPDHHRHQHAGDHHRRCHALTLPGVSQRAGVINIGIEGMMLPPPLAWRSYVHVLGFEWPSI
jgi:hypothetical protein